MPPHRTRGTILSSPFRATLAGIRSAGSGFDRDMTIHDVIGGRLFPSIRIGRARPAAAPAAYATSSRVMLRRTDAGVSPAGYQLVGLPR